MISEKRTGYTMLKVITIVELSKTIKGRKIEYTPRQPRVWLSFPG